MSNTTAITTEASFIEQRTLRDQLADRVDVLGKVKALLLIPGEEVATMQMIADFYEIGLDTVNTCYRRNSNEINEDGMITKKLSEFQNVHYEHFEKSQRYAIFTYDNGVTVKVPNRGIRVFSKRAVLRFGMLLRDSAVAREVRTQLLNGFEQLTPEQKTKDIDHETQLLCNFANAMMDGTMTDVMQSVKELVDYKNRCITALEQTNQALATNILAWNDRSKFNKAVRVMAGMIGMDFPLLYEEIYSELYYKHHISVKQRKQNHGGKGSYLDYIHEDEWPVVQKVLAALSQKYTIDFSRVIEKAKLQEGKPHEIGISAGLPEKASTNTK